MKERRNERSNLHRAVEFLSSSKYIQWCWTGTSKYSAIQPSEGASLGMMIPETWQEIRNRASTAKENIGSGEGFGGRLGLRTAVHHCR